MSSIMQIQMAYLCLLPEVQCNVQMSSGAMRARKATSSPQDLGIQTVTGRVSPADSEPDCALTSPLGELF